MSNGNQNHPHTTEEEEEEYVVWRKNAPFLYDELISHALEWPSLTVHSFQASAHPKSNAKTDSLLLGTHTSDDSPNFLMIATVHFPDDPDDDEGHPLVQIERRIPHTSGEVNRARHMPQNTSLVATKTCGDEVHIFLLDSSTKDEVEESDCDGPYMILKGHTKEGYGIGWSPFRPGYLLSGSYDSRICLWDVNAKSSHVLEAKDIYEAHNEDLVEDVRWHLKNENVFGSVGDDRMLMIWDLRSSASKQPEQSVVAHGNVVNSLSFSPFNEWILATASADTTVNLFDLRRLGTSLHTFSSHMEEIVQVDWSPNHETILASCGADRKLMVWDLSRIGDEQSPEDSEDGPPELLFVHGGHTAKISEFSWNPSREWVISSVDEDNILQVWQMAESIYRDDHEIHI